MQNHKESKISIYKTKEMRSMEISNMINEGGLGSEDYYVILKQQEGTDRNKPKQQ